MARNCLFWSPRLLGHVDNLHWTIDEPIAKSLAYICTWCGDPYAKLKVFNHNARLEPFSAVHGCCPSCPGNLYYLPGSLEALTLVKWPLPLELMLHQLQVELSYFKEPSCSNSSHLSPSPA